MDACTAEAVDTWAHELLRDENFYPGAYRWKGFLVSDSDAAQVRDRMEDKLAARGVYVVGTISRYGDWRLVNLRRCDSIPVKSADESDDELYRKILSLMAEDMKGRPFVAATYRQICEGKMPIMPWLQREIDRFALNLLRDSLARMLRQESSNAA